MVIDFLSYFMRLGLFGSARCLAWVGLCLLALILSLISTHIQVANKGTD
jgi:hypothetical protein